VILRSPSMAGGKARVCGHAQRLVAALGAAVAVVLAGAGCSSASHTAPIASAAQVSPTASPSSSPTASPSPAPLTGTASVTRRNPRTGTKVGVSVVTAPGARITVVAHFEAGDRKKTARADTAGLHTFWFPVGSAQPGIRVRVDVRVSAHGQRRSTRVWFTPRQPAPAPAPPSSAPPPPSGCYPKTSSGHCYEPGEFCPHADAGMRGVAGDGEAIICEDNNGLRWEPA
jgi:hypothetical protein